MENLRGACQSVINLTLDVFREIRAPASDKSVMVPWNYIIVTSQFTIQKNDRKVYVSSQRGIPPTKRTATTVDTLKTAGIYAYTRATASDTQARATWQG